MTLIVDGYNVIRLFQKKPVGHQVQELERNSFIDRLQGYLLKKKTTINKMVVVFDGGQLPYPEKFLNKNVFIIYSGHRQSADDWISYHVASLYGSGMCVVVTDDRALSKKIAPFVDLIIKGRDFFELVNKAFSATTDLQGHEKKRGQFIEYQNTFDDEYGNIDKAHLRELIELTTRDIMSQKVDDEVLVDRSHGKADTDSKNTLKIKRILKKL
jgi:predicted RNA-binding protein with PIN domain